MDGDIWAEARELVAARSAGRSGFYRALWGYSPHEGFPRLHLDRHGAWWLAVFHAPEVAGPEVEALRAWLAAGAEGVVFKFRNDDRRSVAAGRVVAGDPRAAESLVVDQGLYRFESHLTSDLDAGAYPDAEALRHELLAGLAKGERLLNAFAYTCLFGVCALRGGARAVINVDVSRHVLAWGRANYALNSLKVDGRDFVAEEALKHLRRLGRAGERFDRIVVDPPPFFSVGKLRRASDETLEEGIEAALGVLAPSGTLHFLQCTARITAAELGERARATVERLGRRASVEVRTWPGEPVSPRELAPTYKEARVRLDPQDRPV